MISVKIAREADTYAISAPSPVPLPMPATSISGRKVMFEIQRVLVQERVRRRARQRRVILIGDGGT